MYKINRYVRVNLRFSLPKAEYHKESNVRKYVCIFKCNSIDLRVDGQRCDNAIDHFTPDNM